MTTGSGINWKSWDTVGGISSIAGTVNSAIAARTQANTAKYNAESAALNYEHQQDMAKVNAGMLEMEAQQVFRAYNRQMQLKGLEAGFKKGNPRRSKERSC